MMIALSQRDRRTLERLMRRVAHAERTFLASLERAYDGVPPQLTDEAERLLRLERGALATWRAERARGRDVLVPLPVEPALLVAIVDEPPAEPPANGNGNGHEPR
jgi:hypothetical protein